MPIHDMLYRCPRCGHDPLDGHKGRAKCFSCGTTYEQGRGSVIIVSPPEGPLERISAASLVADMDRMSGLGTGKDRGRGLPEQSPFREARVALGLAEGYDVIRWRGEVLGFSERISWKGEGLLKLEEETLSFSPSREAEGFSCLLGDIRGVQISSRALQVTLEGNCLYQLEFVSDSPKRWEDLLCFALRRSLLRSGKRIVEFKPRILTTPDR